MSKIRIATTSLAGCFGCHMSFLDMDERLVGLLEYVEFGGAVVNAFDFKFHRLKLPKQFINFTAVKHP